MWTAKRRAILRRRSIARGIQDATRGADISSSEITPLSSPFIGVLGILYRFTNTTTTAAAAAVAVSLSGLRRNPRRDFAPLHLNYSELYRISRAISAICGRLFNIEYLDDRSANEKLF